MSNPNHPMRKIIDYAIGSWLENKNDEEYLEQFFLNEAKEDYLDLHGKNFNVKRRVDESDEDYRQRIIYESLGHLTIDFLINVYDVELYVYVPNFNIDENTLTSDNPYISNRGFLLVSNEETMNILNKKFVLDSNVHWLII